MLFLLLAILCSSAITLILKLVQTRHLNGNYVLLFNYVTTSLSALLLCLRKNLFPALGGGVLTALRAFAEPATVKGSGALALCVGVCSGVLYLAGLLLIQANIPRNGIGITALFNKCSFLFSILFAILLWHEMPAALQWVGIALAIFSLLLINTGKNQTASFRERLLLPLLLFSNGLSEVNGKVFTQYALPEYKDLFLFVIFTTALIACALMIKIRELRAKAGHRVRFDEIAAGVCVGIPNICSSYFQLKALQVLPASVFFPAFCVGGILLVTAVGAAAFRERLMRRQKIAMLLTMISLVLINLKL